MLKSAQVVQACAKSQEGLSRASGSENCSLFVMPSHTQSVWHRMLSSQPASSD